MTTWLPAFAVRRFLHVIAATIWVGGQLVMLGALPVLRERGSEVTRAVGKAYNQLAWPAFVVLIATGIWNILFYSLNGLNITILSIKLTLVFFSGVGAAAHQLAVSYMPDGAKGRTAILAVGATISTLFAVIALYLGFIVTYFP